NKIIVGEIEFGDECLPDCSQIVAVHLRRFAFGDGSLLNFLAVFVQTGKEKYFLPKASPGACDHVSNDFLVSMAQMRLTVYVINRCCDVKAFAHSAVTVAN